MKKETGPLAALRHHVTGAIERGEAVAIVAKEEWTPAGCPWGPIQTLKRISPALVWVTTAGHGGLCLQDNLWAMLRRQFPNSKSYGGEGFLEEDCDWALAPMVFPGLFTDRDIYYAVETIRGMVNYHVEGNAFLDTPAAWPVLERAQRHAKSVTDARPNLKVVFAS